LLVLLRELLKHVPLGDGTSRVGQHIAPVTQLRPRRVTAQDDATDRVGRADTIVVHYSDDQLDFLSPLKQHNNNNIIHVVNTQKIQISENTFQLKRLKINAIISS